MVQQADHGGAGPVDFFEAPGVDRLMEVAMGLAAELWVVRRRQAVLEALVIRNGLLTSAQIEEFHFDGETAAAQRAERDRFVQRALGALVR